MSPTYLSRQGLQQLQKEQKDLIKQKRGLTEEVSRAAAMGDLRENAEYHAARERLQHVSERLGLIENKLLDVVIIDDLDTAHGEARVGTTVTLEDVQTKESFRYRLVGEDEADPLKEKISITSPLGKALLGKTEGEQFTLKLPAAVVQYRVMSVERV